jgi:membrane protease subunit HflC
MKRHPITLVTAGVLALIFALMLFTFQVRQTETAVVATFGKYSRGITTPGFNWRLPWPIQEVYRFDNRVQNFERKFEQTTTRDAINILITVYAGWRVVDPRLFLESLNGDPLKAEQTLEPLIRNAKNGVLSQFLFGDLISTNPAALKFDQIESNMLALVQPQARSTYGLGISFLGIKQLGLPESITAKVFDRMRAERQIRVREFQTEGEKAARFIRSDADSLANKTLADARARVIEINGNAEAKASEYYKVFQQSPELAIFLFQKNALEQATKEKTTIILDQQIAPFNIMSGQSGGLTNLNLLK